jgi:hypothetical protein
MFPEFRKRKTELTEKNYFRLLMQTEMENISFFVVGKQLTEMDDCCFSQRAYLRMVLDMIQSFFSVESSSYVIGPVFIFTAKLFRSYRFGIMFLCVYIYYCLPGFYIVGVHIL